MNSARALRPVLALAILCMLAAGVPARPQKPGLQGGKVLVENDRVIVVEGIIEPGQDTGMHRHELPAIVITLEGGTLRETLGSGDILPRTLQRKPGEVV